MLSLSSISSLTISIALTLLLQPFLADAHPSPTPAAQLDAADLNVAIRADATTNTTALLLEVLEGVTCSSAPTNAAAIISAVAQAAPTSIPEAEEEFIQVVESCVDVYSVEEIIDSATPPPPSVNPWPRRPIYPKKSHEDAPYSLSEQQLLSVIDIPSTFTYGKKPPVIIVPYVPFRVTSIQTK